MLVIHTALATLCAALGVWDAANGNAFWALCLGFWAGANAIMVAWNIEIQRES